MWHVQMKNEKETCRHDSGYRSAGDKTKESGKDTNSNLEGIGVAGKGVARGKTEIQTLKSIVLPWFNHLFHSELLNFGSVRSHSQCSKRNYCTRKSFGRLLRPLAALHVSFSSFFCIETIDEFSLLSIGSEVEQIDIFLAHSSLFALVSRTLADRFMSLTDNMFNCVAAKIRISCDCVCACLCVSICVHGTFVAFFSFS